MDESTSVLFSKLLIKSQEAFMVAIELYNKPTIKYRVEAFSFFICNAWELMLKAKIISEQGRQAIFYSDNPDRSISLENCIAIVFTNNKDPLRKNLESILKLRNAASHLIVEEYEQIYAPLFQACVNNYDDKMAEFHSINISDNSPASLLMLSMNTDPIRPETLRAKYPPEIAEAVLFEENKVLQDMYIEEHYRFAVLVRTDLAIVKDPRKADFTVAVSRDSEAVMRVATRTQNPNDTHPFSVSQAVEIVNRALTKNHIVLSTKGINKDFTKSDWDLFNKFYGFKENSEFAFEHKVANSIYYQYSQRAIDLVVLLLTDNPSGVIDDLKEKARDNPRSKGF